MKFKNKTKFLIFLLFSIYMLFLLFLTFMNGVRYKDNVLEDIVYRWNKGIGFNFKPFRTIKRYCRYKNADFYINIVGNIVFFIPYGVCIPIIWEKMRTFWKMFFASLCLPLFIETVQLFIGRSTDIDDVILNLLGGMIGAFIFWMGYIVLQRGKEKASYNVK